MRLHRGQKWLRDTYVRSDDIEIAVAWALRPMHVMTALPRVGCSAYQFLCPYALDRCSSMPNLPVLDNAGENPRICVVDPVLVDLGCLCAAVCPSNDLDTFPDLVQKALLRQVAATL